MGNLLDNAPRFTPENGSIQIARSQHEADFEVAVSDNGYGISSRGSDGAGLGLALVKSIVDLHGGSAVIDSNLGRGTTVKLLFPLSRKEKSPQHAISQSRDR